MNMDCIRLIISSSGFLICNCRFSRVGIYTGEGFPWSGSVRKGFPLLPIGSFLIESDQSLYVCFRMSVSEEIILSDYSEFIGFYYAPF